MTPQTPYQRALELLIRRIAGAFKVPPLALDMFRSANEMSGLDRKTIPTELIPLNTIQLARGLLNFTVLQTLQDWVFPFWAERQYDPADPAFIPRSHLGLSINVTHRNWTAVGSMACTTEPVVDPRGLVTAHRNGWSIDLWLRAGDDTLFPSRAPGVTQSLREGLPVLDTTYTLGEIRCVTTAHVSNRTLVLTAAVTNTSAGPRDAELAFAVRPFNPEGVSLIHDLAWDPAHRSFLINEKESVRLLETPDRVTCSTLAGGDSASEFRTPGSLPEGTSAGCDKGLANGFAAHAIILAPAETRLFRAEVALEPDPTERYQAEEAVQIWRDLLDRGTAILTPDQRFDHLLSTSVSTLLLLADDGPITPGPWTYHQFWFRDAAMMVRALDLYGHHDTTRRIIESFPGHQLRSGYYRSQQGEWDSNGQALWTIWQHARLTGDLSMLESMFASMEKGVRWILNTRMVDESDRTRPWAGLLPQGLSAEHLGLADYYFWDNWWSLAGLEAFQKICRMTGRSLQADALRSRVEEYRGAIERAVEFARRERNTAGIPAGPLRGVDSGMIGSCIALYPLQISERQDARVRATLETLEAKFFSGGMFLQNFIHSGWNAYLSLHVAHAWLYMGERDRFWQILESVASHASPTRTYPEAIHPRTGGGAMGDGHHGWAAAEIALAFREAFVYDRAGEGTDVPTLVLLPGIPAEWFRGNAPFSIRNAPVEGGRVSLAAAREGDQWAIAVSLESGVDRPIELRLPLTGRRIRFGGTTEKTITTEKEETVIRWRGSAGMVDIVVGGE